MRTGVIENCYENSAKEQDLSSGIKQPKTRIRPDQAFSNPTTRKTSRFIRGIGLPLEGAEIHEKTFLPGIAIHDGVLLVDESKLKHPGDLLHEAGHLVTIAPDMRPGSQEKVGESGGDEMMAIA